MLKSGGGAADDLRLEWFPPARRVGLGDPGGERCSFGFFVAMTVSGHAYLLSLVLLTGQLRGTPPGLDRAAAGSAS